MWINVNNMREKLPELKRMLIESYFKKLGYDQLALNSYYGSMYDYLDPLFNWKPYWGVNNNAFILHFHGPKPPLIEAFLRTPIQLPKAYIPLLNDSTINNYKHYLNIYNKLTDFNELYENILIKQ